jgi:uncharacterized protein
MITRRTFLGSLAAAAAGYALSGVAARASAAESAQERDFLRAVEMDDAGTVQALLRRGVDPNGTSRAGEPALVLAVREGSMKVLAALLAAPGIRVDATALNGNTALMMAAFKANRPAVDALLARGAAVNREGWTPLHYAAASGDVGIAGLLLERGARIDAASPKASGSYTPLMMAAREGRQDCAVFLAGKGADRALRNGEGLTAAQIAGRADHAAIAAALR